MTTKPMMEIPHMEIKTSDVRLCADEDLRLDTGVSPVVPMLRDILQGREQESFIIVIVDVRGRAVGWREVARGAADRVQVPIRELWRTALACDARALVIAHNHPNDDPTPSQADISLTRVLREGGAMLNIPILDHIVIGGGDRYYSFSQGGHQSSAPMETNAKRQPPEFD
jgi:DNA repair protein RadC